MAMLQFSINSELHTRCPSCTNFFPAPTRENTVAKRSDGEYLYTHITYLFFFLPPTVKQVQIKEKKIFGKCTLLWSIR